MDMIDQNKTQGFTNESFKMLSYMEKYPKFYFRSSRLAKKIGISPQKASKLLLELHKSGLLHRIDVGKSRRKPYYRIKLQNKIIE